MLHTIPPTFFRSPAMAEVFHLTRLYSELARPVVLSGPTGVGKGYCARLLHGWSGVPGPFVEITGGQLTESLLHSQLFGHVAGAFTGARGTVRGAFAQAAEGTLFLDEMQHWPMVLQSALLHVLGEGKFRPIGAEQELPVTCRMLFASARRLDDLVDEGLLLPDLRWRVSSLEIVIPPLSRRREDIMPLADEFLAQARESFRATTELSFGPGTIARFVGHEWPGNLRELRSVVEYSVIHASAAGAIQIDPEHLPERLREPQLSLGDLPADTRRSVIDWMLQKSEGNRTQTAARLGIHRNTVTRRLRKQSLLSSESELQDLRLQSDSTLKPPRPKAG